MFGAPAGLIVFVALVFALPGVAQVAGALAIGQTEDLAKDGYSIGIAVNAASDTVAQRGALAGAATTARRRPGRNAR
jgi:hypothetical protein